MLTHLRPALVLFAGLSLITGIVYPLAMTGVAQAVFPDKANGSLIRASDGRVVGSALIGQDFSAGDPGQSAKWFWGRPSATSPVGYTALNMDKSTGSSGSNLAPSNPALVDGVKARIELLNQADIAVGLTRAGTGPSATIPIDLVTASGSGLDPHISPASAEYQAPRIAMARGLSVQQVRELVSVHTTRRTFGVLGEPTVNVLELNLSLEHLRR